MIIIDENDNKSGLGEISVIEKPLNKKKDYKKLIIILISILVLIIGIYFIIDNITPSIKKVNLKNYDYENDQITINIEVNNILGQAECYLSPHETKELSNKEHSIANNGICSFTTNLKDYYVYIKRVDKESVNEERLSDHYKNTIDIITGTERIYLALGEEETINAKVITLNQEEDLPTWEVLDENVITVKDGLITPHNIGETIIKIITSDGYTKELEVIVTDLISSPIIDNTRAFLVCKAYQTEEANTLDDILKSKISNAGYKTRAGVVEAARFLTLRFKYRINYFVENGRLNNYGNIDHVDGEGRYYHKGLYLSEEKYKSISASQNGPAMWGCPLMQDNGLVRENGFDCSGFVTWVLYNGGFDVKDTGAGYTQRTDDLSDLGEFNNISLELLRSGKVKAGDLIGSDGHAAIIAGIDEENIYIAESLVYNTGVTMLTYKYEELANSTKFTYISLMDSVYKKDGAYTSMW